MVSNSALRHRLGRAGQRDVMAVGAAVDIARRRGVGRAADPLLDGAGFGIDRRLGAEHREDQFQQRQVDHLPPSRAVVAGAQCGHRGERAIETRDHVCERQRRQHRLAVGKAGARGKPAHRLDQRAEARQRGVGPGLAEARHPHDDQPGVGLVQHIGAEPHLLQGARPVVFDEDVGGGDQPQQRVLRRVLPQVEHHRALVARVGLPVQRFAAVAPVAQRIARRWLDLDHVCAEIAELERDHVAGHELRQVQYADAVQWAACIGVEADGRCVKLLHSGKILQVKVIVATVSLSDPSPSRREPQARKRAGGAHLRMTGRDGHSRIGTAPSISMPPCSIRHFHATASTPRERARSNAAPYFGSMSRASLNIFAEPIWIR